MDFALDEDSELLRDNVAQFCRTDVLPEAAAWDEAASFPRAALGKLAELGLMGLQVPEDRGGVALGQVPTVAILEALAHGDGSLALAVATHNLLGIGQLLQAEAVDVESMAAGETFVTGALAEERDPVLAQPDGAGFVLDGTMRLVPGATEAGSFVVNARIDEEPAAFWVDADARGVSRRSTPPTMGMRAAGLGTVVLRNVRVPAPRRVAVGEGVRRARTGMRLALAAIACGIGRAALETGAAYANERKQFGKPIGAFQGIQWKIANSSVELEAAWLMVLRSAWAVDAGEANPTGIERAKVFASEAASRAASEALQIHGGYGYTREFPVERHLRDARLLALGGGTTQAHRRVIAQHLAQRFAEG